MSCSAKTMLTHAMFLVFALCLSGCIPAFAPPKADYTDTLSGMPFVLVKGGTYLMGDGEGVHQTELPAHEVTVEDFLVSIYEVSFAQYDSYAEATGQELLTDHGWGRGRRPVVGVTWDEAKAYAAWLSDQTGLQFSLPTEAQWEYFARAGTTGPYCSGAELPAGSANCSDCGSRYDNRMTAKVGTFPPNPWGVFDTAGNIVEWVLDDYQDSYEGAPVDGSARIIDGSQRKVQRGGGWNWPKTDIRSSARDSRKALVRNSDTGFRLVLAPAPQLLPASPSVK